MVSGPAPGAAPLAAAATAAAAAGAALPRRLALRSVQDLPGALADVHGAGRDGAAFRRVYRVTDGPALALASPALAQKYAIPEESSQRVISITNRRARARLLFVISYAHSVTLDQAWWNPTRGNKPQTFKAAPPAGGLDTTGGGASCDFCAYREMTARDDGFGRVELRHAVTGSNLFKFAEPAHGVVMFRHHDPLSFDAPQLADLLDASWLWFRGAAAAHAARAQVSAPAPGDEGAPDAAWPALLWNCLPRAGASQFHGHAQVALTRVPLPEHEALASAAGRYVAAGGGGGGMGGGGADGSAASVDTLAGGGGGGGGEVCFYSDLLRAHRAVGLLRQVTVAAAAAAPRGGGAAASGSGGGASSSSLSSSDSGEGGAGGAWEGSAWAFPSLAPRKDCEVFVVGSHLGCAAFQALLHAALRTLIDGLGVATFNAAAFNIDLSAPHPHAARLAAAAAAGAAAAPAPPPPLRALPRDQLWVPAAAAGGRPPVVARIVSRGKLGAPASDFGAIEVFCRASIGHTDPFAIAAALDAQLAALGG
ncbi:MAG: hypothetical protein J3K34DRAFT_458990 [Monoraphidium minutum]|nr:MAG: hypothetical protein J3K34DRAFT_458990 [Monoraphidium minutum]